jgi:hypothetical protein
MPKFPNLFKAETWDGPGTFVFAMILVLVPVLAFANFAFSRAGLPGPSALIRNAG